MQTNIGERSFLKMIMQMIAHDRLSRIMNRITGYAGNENDGQCKRQSALQSSPSCQKNIFLKIFIEGRVRKKYSDGRGTVDKKSEFFLYSKMRLNEKKSSNFSWMFSLKNSCENTPKRSVGWNCEGGHAEGTHDHRARGAFPWGLCSFALSM